VSIDRWLDHVLGGGDEVTAVQPFFRQSNYAEAAFWGAIGLIVIIWARRRKALGPAVYVLAANLFLFGGSDLVEAQTGAWWRPWWLLVWKGVCIGVFLALVVQHYRTRKRPQE
jgi:hypothetical protein